MPARAASSTAHWIPGRSTTGIISFGIDFVAGRNLVPSPPAGITAFVTCIKQAGYRERIGDQVASFSCDEGPPATATRSRPSSFA